MISTKLKSNSSVHVRNVFIKLGIWYWSRKIQRFEHILDNLGFEFQEGLSSKFLILQRNVFICNFVLIDRTYVSCIV